MKKYYFPLVVVLNIIFTNVYSQNYQIGDIGPAGGIVFYDQGSIINGWRYLEVCPTDNNTNSSSWGCYCVSFPSLQSGIGTGVQNSNTVISSGCAGLAFTYCDTLSFGGYSDWFLPSKDELQLIRDNIYTQDPSSFTSNVYYWSSTPALYGSCGIDGGAYALTFNSNVFSQEYRPGIQNQGLIRAIRSFSGITGLNENNVEIILSPNPNNGQFTINVGTSLIGKSYNLITTDGKIIQQDFVPSEKFEINIQNQISTGVYFLEIGNNIKRIVINDK